MQLKRQAITALYAAPVQPPCKQCAGQHSSEKIKMVLMLSHLTYLLTGVVSSTFTLNESLWLAIGKYGVELEHSEAHPSDR
jgi:nitric oxide reductase large subunit